jgi:hypothetical protein
MRRSSKSSILIVALILILVGGVALWVLTDTAPPEEVGSGAASPAVGARPLEDESTVETDPRQGVGATIQPPNLVQTTVAWPVEVSLELVRAAHMPRAKGVPPLGTGRTAALRGRIQDKVERGVAAEIRFVGGANTGRALHANAEGEFGATDLLPGIAIVKVSGPGIPGSVREVHLRQTKEEVLFLSHGMPGSMHGTVYGPGNEPLAGVDVRLDGHPATTNEEGEFFYPSMTPGVNLVLVLRKEGYAHHFQRVAVAAGRRMTKGRYRYAMQPQASLQVAVPDRVGGPGKTQLILLPANTHVARAYPWWLVNPAEVIPGSSVRIDGLPPLKIAIRTFHDGALAEPADKRVTLRAGRVVNETIRLRPAPKLFGVVRDREGRFVEGARVTMEAPDRVGATMFHLGEMPSFLNTEVVPSFPVAYRETYTDAYGRYLLSAWPGVAKGQYLIAESRDGELWAGQVVKPPSEPGDQEIDLTLEPIAVGAGRLSIEFPGRTQGVPVEVTLNGEPLDPGVVPLGVPLVIEDVAEGTWRLRATWNGRPVIGGAGYQEFELRGDTEQSVHLPEGAIAGQDADTLLRTGRHGS